MREEENLGYWPKPPVPDEDIAWTPKEKRNMKLLLLLVATVALVCCGAGIGLGVAFA